MTNSRVPRSPFVLRFSIIAVIIIVSSIVALTAFYDGSVTNAQQDDPHSPSAIFTVTNTNDSGAGSLRQAILNANGSPGLDIINFSIGSGPQTITPASALPTVFEQVLIDGWTQPGFTNVPLVEINGMNTGGSDGLTISGGGTTVRGLIINRFGTGIRLSTVGSNTIHGNYLGTNTAGGAALANSFAGLQINNNSTNNQIGGTGANQRNVISGNTSYGIYVTTGSTGTQIQGNFIGTNAAGTAAIANGFSGVDLRTSGNTVGGTTTAARNLVSGNGTFGIAIGDPGSTITGNFIVGNYVGLNANGNAAIANGSGGSGGGITLQNGPANTTIGGSAAGAGNVISGNGGTGIGVGGSGGAPTATTIQGNRIGTDAGGASGIGNLLYGIIFQTGVNSTVGGTVANSGNTIAFNGDDGIHEISGPNAILANSIYSNGTNPDHLGIDLPGVNGIDPNDPGDPDTFFGINDLQNYPILTSAASSGGGNANIQGSLNTNANNTYRIEFFANSTCDASGNGEGQIYLGATNVTTNGNGDAAISTTVPAPAPNSFITSTATRLVAGVPTDTSEFSACTQYSAGSVQFRFGGFGAGEGIGNAVIEVERVGGNAGDAFVQYDASPIFGTATPNVDYVPTSGTLFWADGESSSKFFLVQILQDGLPEANEDFALRLFNPIGVSLGTPSLVPFTIFDDDNVVSISVAPSAVLENSGATMVYAFTRSVTGSPLTVNFSVSGTACSIAPCANGPVDLNVSGAATFNGTNGTGTGTGTVTFGAANSTATVNVTPIGDTLPEGDETITFTVTNGSGYIVGTPAVATGTIINDDATVQVSVAPISVAEDGPTNLTYTFTRVGSTTSGLTVNYSLSGSATLTNADFQNPPALGSNTVSFSPGASTATVVIDPIPDPIVESDENITITITAGSGYIIGSPSSATGTIINDDTDIFCSIGPNSVVEDGAGNLVYNCTRTGVTASALAVPFALGGTATLSSDYVVFGNVSGVSPSGGTLNFGAGSSSASIVVDPTPDSFVEFEETVIVTFASGLAFNVNPNPTVLTGVIVNDDTDVSVAVSLTNPVATGSSVPEDGAQNLLYTFTRNTTPAVLSQPLTINFSTTGGATSGADYTQTATGTILFAAGASTVTVIVDPIPDSIVEGDEQVIITVTGGSGYNIASPSVAVGTIIDDDVASPGTLQFSSSTYTQTENEGTVTLTVTRTSGVAGTVAASYSTAPVSATPGGTCAPGVDYVALAGTVSLAAGVTSQTISIPICDDTLFEVPESFTVTIANPTGGATLGSPSTTAVTIQNNDAPPTLSINDVTVSESAGTASLTLVLDTPSGVNTNFVYATGAAGDTAIFNVDYTQTNGTGVIPAGSVSLNLLIPIIDDTLAESDEIFSMVLSAPVNATISDNIGTVTIQDNDSGGCPVRPIAYGQTYDAAITEASCFIPNEGRVDLYSFAGTAGQRIVINMTTSSGSFQARLQLMSPANVSLSEVSGQPAFNDARLPTSNSFLLPSTGFYTIRAKELFILPGTEESLAAESPDGLPDNPYRLSLNLVPPAGCTYTFTPRTNAVAAGGEYSFFVVTQPGCPMADPPPQTGVFYRSLTYRSNLVRFTLPQNPNASPRQETITVAGQTHTINQYGTAIPTNDNLINAQTITGASSRPDEAVELDVPDAPVEGYNFAATAEPGEPAHAGNTAARSVWYSWTAPGPLDGLYSFTTSGSGFDTVMAIYECPATGVCNFGNFSLVGSNDDTTFYDNTSKVNFRAQSGRRYVIAIDGKNGATGTIQLTWRSYVRLFRLYLQNFSGFPSSFVPTTLTASNGSNTVQPFFISRGVYEFSLPADNSVYFINITGPTGIVWAPNNIPIGAPSNRPAAPEGGLDGAQNVVSNARNAADYPIIGYIKDLNQGQISTLRVLLTNARGPNVQPPSDCGESSYSLENGINYAIYGCTSQPETNHEVVPSRPSTRFRLPVRILDGYITGPEFGTIDKALVADTTIATSSISGQVLFGGPGTQVDLKFIAPGINREITLTTTTGQNGAFSFPVLERGLTYTVRAFRTGVIFTQPTPIVLASNQTVNIPAVSCTFTPGPFSQVPGTGGDLRIDIATNNPSCEWTTSTTTPWITLNSGEFPGNGPIHITVQANPNSTPRSGSINLLGRNDPITIQQAAGGASGIEGDVVDGSGAPRGDDQILANDVAALRRLVLGTQAPDNTTNQFQRADINIPCGNGQLESGDVTVVRAMVLGTIPNNTPACGPLAPTITSSEEMRSAVDAAAEGVFSDLSLVRIPGGERTGGILRVPVEIDSSELIGGAGFALSFDHSRLYYVKTELAIGAPSTAVLSVNERHVKDGKIGILIDTTSAYPPGKYRILIIEFRVRAFASENETEIKFGGLPMINGLTGLDGSKVHSEFINNRISIYPEGRSLSTPFFLFPG